MLSGRIKTWKLGLLAVALLGSLVSLTRAGEGQFYGLLRERDLTPFGFMRLDMRPAHAVSTERVVGQSKPISRFRTPGR